ncbi:MAG: hypothetical protein EOM47_08285 [Bacteroidia bacterium]|nr:hypothetical protein [Bacteroidia bacterium]
MKKKVYIDASVNVPYGSFYIKGLCNIYGKKNVKFSKHYFLNLTPLGKDVRFVIVENQVIISKVFIHTNDSYKINEDHYSWCDVYGNVNANFNHYPKDKYPKQVSLVPSFAIRNFNLVDTLFYSISNFFYSYNDILSRKVYNKYATNFERKPFKNIKRHFSGYIKNYRNRLPLESYANQSEIENNYIFFLSTLWYSDDYNRNDEGVNRRRANFIEVCNEKSKCKFEGGLLADNSSSKNFVNSTTTIRLSFDKWICKTKKSVLVFNTPAFWDCHGWKLGEYLALGKAIISTPLSNDLPEPLVHGKHIHIIPDSSKESIRIAVEYILNNPEYRKTLELNARKYWYTYGEPISALKLLGIK